MNLRFAIAASRFNEEITDKLVASCEKTLRAHGARVIKTVRVPGGYEIPWLANELARSGRYDAVICIGCVLKGQTPQNDHISRSVIDELARIAARTRVPCILGVITPNTWAQAVARTRGAMDRGKESALAALEMAALKRKGF
jgi:6,7-dimethyl-8-ribityllumazine synthase